LLAILGGYQPPPIQGNLPTQDPTDTKPSIKHIAFRTMGSPIQLRNELQLQANYSKNPMPKSKVNAEEDRCKDTKFPIAPFFLGEGS
jgi:hypothetical protein